MPGVIQRVLYRGPRRMQIRTTLFFSRGIDGELPALENALASARRLRAAGRAVWIESADAPAYRRPSELQRGR